MFNNSIIRLSAITVVVLAFGVGSAPAGADPLPYGPDTCATSFVWREARSGDTVCVLPSMRSTILGQNADPSAHKDPAGAYGPESCAQGFVWREAFDGDTICVTSDFRSQVKADNASADKRKAANVPAYHPRDLDTVIFEVTGSGTVFSVVTNPATSPVGEDRPMPFKRTIEINPDTKTFGVTVSTKSGSQGCRITVNGTVVAEQPAGDSPQCAYTR
jgi:hypothetical protein